MSTYRRCLRPLLYTRHVIKIMTYIGYYLQYSSLKKIKFANKKKISQQVLIGARRHNLGDFTLKRIYAGVCVNVTHITYGVYPRNVRFLYCSSTYRRWPPTHTRCLFVSLKISNHYFTCRFDIGYRKSIIWLIYIWPFFMHYSLYVIGVCMS